MISGYLISGIILGKVKEDAFSFREFYARRIARIFPALVVVLAAVLLLGWTTLLGSELRQLGRHAVASAAFVANEIFRHEVGYFDSAAELKPLLHLWSLGVEEQFYIVWPALLWLVARRGVAWQAITATVVISFALNLLTVSRFPTGAFFLTAVRLWELATGALIAWLSLEGRLRAPSRPNFLSWTGAAMIATACVAFGPSIPFPGWRALLPTLGAALVIIGGEGAWLNRQVLARRPVVYVGLISYPLYLWHWPLLSFARLTRLDAAPSPVLLAGAIALAAVLSVLTYELIERPIRFGRAARRWRTPALAAAMVAVVALGTIAWRGRITPWLERGAVPYEADRERYQPVYRTGICLFDEGKPAAPAPACEDAGLGDSTRTSIVLWGDSHAAHLYPGFASLAVEDRLALAQHTMANCVPVLDAEPAVCADFNRRVMQRIRVLRPRVVVLASRWHQDVERLGATVAELDRLGIERVVVVGPVPRWVIILPRLLLLSRRSRGFDAPPDRMAAGLDTGTARVERQVVSALDGRRAAYVSAIALFCNREGCLTTVDGKLAVWDHAHLTEPASRLLARRILEVSRATP